MDAVYAQRQPKYVMGITHEHRIRPDGYHRGSDVLSGRPIKQKRKSRPVVSCSGVGCAIAASSACFCKRAARFSCAGLRKSESKKLQFCDGRHTRTTTSSLASIA
jgi:hypothetical protein